LISRAGPCDRWISKISRFFRCRISDDLKVALRSVIRERLIYLDKTELDARVRVSRSQVFVELFTRTKTRIFLEKDRDARVDRVVVPTPAISLSA
jgi:hypothetical protein